jgi:periplasmic protein TonB
MFEDSLVESRVGHLSPSKRWTTLASIGLQIAIAGIVIALPLLHPEALPLRVDAPKMLLPLPLKPPVPVVRAERASAASTSLAVPSAVRARVIPSLLPSRDADDAPPLAPIGANTGMPDGIPDNIGFGGRKDGPTVTMAPTRPIGRISVTRGVLQGMLLAPIRPIYPAIAKAAHVEGTVVVEAIISRAGTIESLHVLSGPIMLQGAAMDAIRAARYQPYRLNDAPVEVQTTITVNFRLGG